MGTAWSKGIAHPSSPSCTIYSGMRGRCPQAWRARSPLGSPPWLAEGGPRGPGHTLDTVSLQMGVGLRSIEPGEGGGDLKLRTKC